MKHPRWILAAVFASGISATIAAVQLQKGGTDQYGPYTPVRQWFKPVRQGYFERGASVFAESPDRIIVTSDFEAPMPLYGDASESPTTPRASPSRDHHYVMILDGNGNVVDEWKQWDYLFNCPHEVQISPYDPDRSVWIADRDNSQVFKFSHDGKKLLMTLGEKGVVANDDTHFGHPADVSFAPDGSFYVADGYINTRVIKFDKNGKRLLTWGSEGSGPGQFRVQVHDVAVDEQGRVYVADRGNNRIQVFDANGKYLDEWDNVFNPNYIYITKDHYVWVLSGQEGRLVKYDMNGHLITYWGTPAQQAYFGPAEGQFDDPHAMSMDSAGNLYVANYSERAVGVVKFVPNPSADRSRLVSPGVSRFLPATNRTASH
jgi:DNA-binding beta-propeller fold protein YncE